jgi:hypothetical protein
LVQYHYWHIPLPELAFKNDARTGIGIVAHWFITGMGIVRYWYWHLILPVPVLAFLHFGSVPVQAQSITRIGIQKMVLVSILAFLHFGSVPVWAHSITGTRIQQWFQYRYWIFCTLVHF